MEADQVEAIWRIEDEGEEEEGREREVAGLLGRPRMCKVELGEAVVLEMVGWEGQRRRECARPRASWVGGGPGGLRRVGTR